MAADVDRRHGLHKCNNQNTFGQKGFFFKFAFVEPLKAYPFAHSNSSCRGCLVRTISCRRRDALPTLPTLQQALIAALKVSRLGLTASGVVQDALNRCTIFEKSNVWPYACMKA